MQRARFVLIVLILLGSTPLATAQGPYEFGFEYDREYIWDTEVILYSDYISEGDRTNYEYTVSIIVYDLEWRNDSYGFSRYIFDYNYTAEFTSGNLTEFQSYFGLQSNETTKRSYFFPTTYFSPINSEYLSSLNDSIIQDNLNFYTEQRVIMGSNTYEIQYNQLIGDRSRHQNTTSIYSLNTGVLLKHHYIELFDKFGIQRREDHITVFRGLEILYIPPYSYYAMAAVSTIFLMIVLVIFYFVKKRRN